MELPKEMSTENPVHTQTIYQAIEASTQSLLENVRKPAEQLLKACEEVPGYTSILVAIAGTHAAAADARAGAVILLKNMVRVRWKSRGQRAAAVGEGEKAALKQFLLAGAMEEPEARVASQLAVLIGKVARVDWPRQWPELFPALVTSLVSGNPARQRMALCSTSEVLKELSTKRIGFDKAAFITTAAELLPVLCRSWDAQWSLVASILPSVAVGGGADAVYKAGSEAAGAVTLATVCVKIIRRLLQFGIPGLEHPHVEPLFEGLLQRMRAVTAALERHQAATQLVGAGVGLGDGRGGVVEELQELLERMASTAVGAQKDHPIGFRRYLAAHLSFFHEELSNAARAPRSLRPPGGAGAGEWTPSETAMAYPVGPFCVQCMSFVGNVVGCSSYREDVLEKAFMAAGNTVAAGGGAGRPRAAARLITGKGDAIITPEAARGISTAMADFFTSERVVGLLEMLLEGFLQIGEAELEEWRDAPEQYYLVQDSLDADESVRVSAEHLYMALLEAGGRNVGGVLAAAVAKMLSQGINVQIEACRQTIVSPGVLAFDSLYLCAGLGAYTVKNHMDFLNWFQAFLAPALEALVSTMLARVEQDVEEAPPSILLRRLMWLIGCWADQIPASLRPALVQATANVIKAKEADVVVRLSAVNALQALLSLWDLDPEQCLAPALGWLVPSLYRMFEDVHEMDSRQLVLTVMSELLERSGRLLVPHCQAAVEGLPKVWNATSSQTPLRCSCLQVMTHVVEALGARKGPDLSRIAVNMVDVATKVGSDEAVYLTESGLELWLALLRHLTEYDEAVHALFPRIPDMLEGDLDNLRQAMLIVEAYVVIGGPVFLQAHGPLVCRCFCRVVGQVKPKGAAFVSRALESLLRKFPADGSRMLESGGVVRKVIEACLVAPGDNSAREPDLVIVQHLTIICRVLLGAPEAFRVALQQVASSTGAADGGRGGNSAGTPEKLLADLLTDLVGQMVVLFDASGYSTAGVWRRRLWAMALLKLLAEATGGVASFLDQIVNICVDVLTEEREHGGRKLKEAMDQNSTDQSGIASSAPSVLQSRLNEALKTDISVTTDLRLLVRASMDALRATLGDDGWQAAVETVEPVILAQLRAMVA